MVYPDQENPRSRQLPPRIVCRFLPCWYQGEIRVPASFRCDRDQLIFLGIRRSESTEPRALASGRSRLLPRAASLAEPSPGRRRQRFPTCRRPVVPAAALPSPAARGTAPTLLRATDP